MNGLNGMMGFWAIVWLLFAALLVVGIVVLVRSLGGGDPAGSRPTRPAVQILEERFARGEIDRDEFEERRRTLES